MQMEVRLLIYIQQNPCDNCIFESFVAEPDALLYKDGGTPIPANTMHVPVCIPLMLVGLAVEPLFTDKETANSPDENTQSIDIEQWIYRPLLHLLLIPLPDILDANENKTNPCLGTNNN